MFSSSGQEPPKPKIPQPPKHFKKKKGGQDGREINSLIQKENDVVIVEIDDDSYRLINESYPYPRGKVYSKVVENLTKAEAKVIVFDIMFDSPDHTSKIIEHHLGKECLECSMIDEDAKFYNSIKFNHKH